MIFNIIFLLILIFFNGLLSASELALLSLEKFEIEKMIKKHQKKSRKIKKIIEDPNTFLSTIQVGITLAGFLSSAFAASTFATTLIENGFFIISKQFTNNFLIIVITFVLSYFTLVLGELVPKKIALSNPYKVATLSVDLISSMQHIFYPLINLSTVSTEFICKLVRIKEQEEEFTEEDIKRIIINGTKDGIIEQKEQEYIFNIFNFNDIAVDKVMTKKEDCITFPDTVEFIDLLKKIKEGKFTRYPVYSGDKNNIIGIFNVKEFIMYSKNNTDFNI